MELFKNKYVMVVVTPKSAKGFISTPFGKTFYSDPNVTVDVVFNNTRGLPEVYNEKIRQFPDSRIIFVHDDVEIHDKFLVEKLDKAFLTYDVVGLAGGKLADFSKYDETKQTLMWHLMSPRNEMSGFVSHYFGNNNWNSSMFGMSPQRVLLIDGLFMAIDAKKCIENGVWFDEDFKFHYYDLSFSLRANDKKLKTGTYPIFVVHHGLGNVDDVGEFLEHQKVFYKKYSPSAKYDR